MNKQCIFLTLIMLRGKAATRLREGDFKKKIPGDLTGVAACNHNCSYHMRFSVSRGLPRRPITVELVTFFVFLAAYGITFHFGKKKKTLSPTVRKAGKAG